MSTDLGVPARIALAAVVDDSVRIADDVVAVTLRSTSGEFPTWDPGAHIDLELPGGVIRQYSLCGERHDRRRMRIAVLRENDGRGGSRAVHGLGLGAVVRVLAVRNRFPLEEAAEYLFVAGGIGITPLLPMIEAAEAGGVPWALHYAGRSRSSMAYAAALRERHGDRVTLYPGDEGARLDLDAVVAGSDPAAGLYCCGPDALMTPFEAVCLSLGRAGHLERFATSTAADDGIRPDDETFEVHLERSGITVQVEPGQSILQVAEAAGGDVFGSCEEGICGTCETRVVEGEVDHRDAVLCGQDTGTMMICVSRALSRRLVLDA